MRCKQPTRRRCGPQTSLELGFDTELEDARIPDGPCNAAEVPCSHAGDWIREMRGIRQVKNLRPELQFRGLAELDVLQNGKIDIHEAGTA